MMRRCFAFLTKDDAQRCLDKMFLIVEKCSFVTMPDLYRLIDGNLDRCAYREYTFGWTLDMLLTAKIEKVLAVGIILICRNRLVFKSKGDSYATGLHYQ